MLLAQFLCQAPLSYLALKLGSNSTKSPLSSFRRIGWPILCFFSRRNTSGKFCQILESRRGSSTTWWWQVDQPSLSSTWTTMSMDRKPSLLCPKCSKAIHKKPSQSQCVLTKETLLSHWPVPGTALGAEETIHEHLKVQSLVVKMAPSHMVLKNKEVI